jgi:hypothetical protein
VPTIVSSPTVLASLDQTMFTWPSFFERCPKM